MKPSGRNFKWKGDVSSVKLKSICPINAQRKEDALGVITFPLPSHHHILSLSFPVPDDSLMIPLSIPCLFAMLPSAPLPYLHLLA